MNCVLCGERLDERVDNVGWSVCNTCFYCDDRAIADEPLAWLALLIFVVALCVLVLAFFALAHIG